MWYSIQPAEKQKKEKETITISLNKQLCQWPENVS